MGASAFMMACIRIGAAAQVVAAPPPAGPVSPTATLGYVNGATDGNLWWYRDQTKSFSDAGVTQIGSGGAIYQTNDMSTRANHLLMTTSLHRPTWSASGATFAGGVSGAGSSGSAMQTTTAGTSSNAKTVFFSITPSVAGILFGSRTGASAGLCALNADGSVEVYCGTSCKTAAGAFTFGTRVTIAIIFAAGTASIYVNGVAQIVTGGTTSGPVGATAFNMMTVCNDGGGAFSSAFAGGLIQCCGWAEGNLSANVATIHSELMAA